MRLDGLDDPHLRSGAQVVLDEITRLCGTVSIPKPDRYFMRTDDGEVTIEWRWGNLGGPSIVFGLHVDDDDLGWYSVRANRIEPCDYTTASGPVPVRDSAALMRTISMIQEWGT